MNISRQWQPWVAGAVVLLVALVAGLAGWWLTSDDDTGSPSPAVVASPAAADEPADADQVEAESDATETDDSSDASAGDGEAPRDGMTRDGRTSRTDSVDADRDGNPDDISDLAGEGEDYGAGDDTDPGEVADTGTDEDDIIFYMPDLDASDYADLFGESGDQPVFDCPPALRTPSGDCDLERFDEPMFIPGPFPGGY